MCNQWPAFRLQDLAEKVDAKQAESGVKVHNDFPLTRRCKTVLNQDANNADCTIKVAVRPALARL